MIRKSINLLLLTLVSCTATPKDDTGAVQLLVQERVSTYQHEGGEPLDAERSVYVALLNNPNVDFHLSEVKRAQADWVAASEISNPFFDFMFRFSNEKKFHNNFEFNVMQNVIDICLRPIKMNSAAADIEREKWQAAHDILQIACDAEAAFYELKAEELLQECRKEKAHLLKAKGDLAKERLQAGSLSAFEAGEFSKNALIGYEELLNGRVVLADKQETFETLLANPCGYVLVDGLPTPIEDPELCSAEDWALNQRLDLQAMRWDLLRLQRGFPATAVWAYTGLALGISQEREPEGDMVTGPAVSGEIPIFTYGKSDRLRLQAEMEQLEASLASLEQKVSAEVRGAKKALAIQKERFQLYEKEVLPLQKQRLVDAQEFYNAMAIDSDQLVDLKIDELDGKIGSIEALRDYWLARVRLKRLLGGVF